MLLNPYRFVSSGGGVQSFVGATAPTPSSISSVTLAMPAGVQAGDLLCVIIVRQPNTQTVTTPSGWTARVDFNAGGGPDRRMYVATKIAGASEPSVTFTFSGTGNTASALLAYRGVSTVTAGTPYSSSSSATATANAVTMPAAGFVLGAFYANGGGAAISVSANPSGMTKRVHPLATNYAQMPVYDQEVSAGTTGARTISWNRASAPTLAVLIGLT